MKNPTRKRSLGNKPQISSFPKMKFKSYYFKMKQNNSMELSGSYFLNVHNKMNPSMGSNMKSRLLIIQETPRNKKCWWAIWVFTHPP